MSEESISVSQHFECPDCKQDLLEEIMVGVQLCTALTDMHSLKNGNVEVEYNQFELEGVQWSDGVVDRYQCANCGWPIQDENNDNITTPEELFEWLKQHKENREKELNTP